MLFFLKEGKSKIYAREVMIGANHFEEVDYIYRAAYGN